MFGLSIKVWSMKEGEEDVEFSLIVTHNDQIRECILNCLQQILIDIKTLSLVESVSFYSFYLFWIHTFHCLVDTTAIVGDQTKT